MQSGKTQRNGVTATSSQSRFVVARSIADPHAASDTQTIRMRLLGCTEKFSGKVIAISGTASLAGNPLEAAERLGASAVLEKPFQLQELLDAITKVLAADR